MAGNQPCGSFGSFLHLVQAAAIEGIPNRRPAQRDRQRSGPKPGRHIIQPDPAGRNDLNIRERTTQLRDIVDAHG